jgi:hypothetical protein
MNLKHVRLLCEGLTMSFLLFMSSCTSSSSSGSQVDNLVIKLIDAPASFDQEVIVIHRVELHRTGASADLGWRIVNGNLGTYDLLTFRNGVSQVVTSAVVPAGSYDAIRLILDGSYVRIGNLTTLLDQAPNVVGGYVIQYPLTIAEGNYYELILDFDAYHSVHQTGPGAYQLTPAVRVQDATLAGSISGAVVSADSSKPLNSLISSTVGSDQVGTSPDMTTGSFLLGALPEGSYSLTISPVDTLYSDSTITGIQVIRQRETPIGAIRLKHK